jgi:hypothetical protein
MAADPRWITTGGRTHVDSSLEFGSVKSLTAFLLRGNAIQRSLV